MLGEIKRIKLTSIPPEIIRKFGDDPLGKYIDKVLVQG